MEFLEAIQKIEERGDYNRYAEVRPALEKELAKLKKSDHTRRGLCYYYLLVSYLKAQLVHETDESLEFYQKMDEAFIAQEHEFKHAKHTLPEEVKDFYRLMDRCYNSLEFLYKRHDFKTRQMAYKRKMRFRKNGFYIRKEWGKWMEYQFLELTSDYGNSIVRWTLTTFSFVFVISFAYMLVDALVPSSQRMIPTTGHWFDYFYFSVIILTTVGLGDIVPISLAGKALVASEAFFGFLMLGVFMGMMHKKL